MICKALNDMMALFKQLYLSWIILSAAAACVSCQKLTSTLREGNRACQGEEVTFTCTVRGPSSLSAIILAWSSDEYISRSLQLSTTDRLEHIETSSMDGVITATARVTNITTIAGELVLESTLRITAVEDSKVTCLSGTDGGTESIKFSISAVPGVPQNISAVEISRPTDNSCIILMEWDPPANSDASDIGQYNNIIVYIPSRNIGKNISSSTHTLHVTALTLSNCGDDIRVQVAAVNHDGCVGMNSFEVQPVPLDIPTIPATTEGGSYTTTEGGSNTTTEGGSAMSTEGGSATCSLPDQLSAGAVAGITIAVALVVIVCICILSGVIIVYIYCHFKKIIQNLTLESHRQSDELKEVD